MQLANLATALAVIGLVAAVPAPSVRIFTKSYVDKFDNIVVLPASTPETNQVGTYGALKYVDFSAASGQINTGRAPPSPPNFIFGADVSVNNQNAQLLPANSSVLHFGLQSLYYACAPLTGGAVGASQSCTIQIAGRKAAAFGGTTAIKELVYDAGLLNGAFKKVVFPNTFSDLVQVTVNVIGAEGTTVTASPNFDNVAYVATFAK